MGLRPLDLAKWLDVDARRRAELSLKFELLSSVASHSSVVASMPDTEEAGQELLALVLDNLRQFHPGLVKRSGPDRLIEETTGTVVDITAFHPVDAAARLIQEDLCLMTRRGGEWVLGAASVCFPSRWSLADKIGRSLSAIHEPVPGYEDALGRATESFFDRLRPEGPMWRLNWTLLGDPSLHQPRAGGGQLQDRVWFRVERQTLRRLSATEALAFTIRTYVTPLGEVVDARPDVAAALLVALSDLPEAVTTYKGWREVVPRVRAWLEERAGAGVPATQGRR